MNRLCGWNMSSVGKWHKLKWKSRQEANHAVFVEHSGFYSEYIWKLLKVLIILSSNQPEYWNTKQAEKHHYFKNSSYSFFQGRCLTREDLSLLLSSFWWLLAIVDFLWLIDISLQSLPPSSHDVLFCVSVSKFLLLLGHWSLDYAP